VSLIRSKSTPKSIKGVETMSNIPGKWPSGRPKAELCHPTHTQSNPTTQFHPCCHRMAERRSARRQSGRGKPGSTQGRKSGQCRERVDADQGRRKLGRCKSGRHRSKVKEKSESRKLGLTGRNKFLIPFRFRKSDLKSDLSQKLRNRDKPHKDTLLIFPWFSKSKAHQQRKVIQRPALIERPHPTV